MLIDLIEIKCFGVAKEIVDGEILKLNRPNLSVEELRKQLLHDYPEFSAIKGFMVAVNQEYATDDMTIDSSDEVAIIPPVSGG